jgi:hypothetical protein
MEASGGGCLGRNVTVHAAAKLAKSANKKVLTKNSNNLEMAIKKYFLVILALFANF